MKPLLLAGTMMAAMVLQPNLARAASETVVYAFKGIAVGDGANPYAGLIKVGGMLYGTTTLGGAGPDCEPLGCGTVFKVTRDGAESVMHSFGGSAGGGSGAFPYASLIKLGGALYGTTYIGGAIGFGTVFKVTKARAEKVVYSFGDNHDGAYPYAGLIDVGGTLYGTTTQDYLRNSVQGDKGRSRNGVTYLHGWQRWGRTPRRPDQRGRHVLRHHDCRRRLDELRGRLRNRVQGDERRSRDGGVRLQGRQRWRQSRSRVDRGRRRA